MLVFKGEHAPQVEQGLKEKDFPGQFHPVKTTEDFDTLLETADISEGVALFKGSRSAHMEELLEAYLARHRTGHGGAR
jgi:UDP-N-acetylmuramyl pentapeptide synthase